MSDNKKYFDGDQRMHSLEHSLEYCYSVEKITPADRKELDEVKAILADYDDWCERHNGEYTGDYWE